MRLKVKICKVRKCGREVNAKGYCQMHWRRVKKGLPLGLIPRRILSHPKYCSVPGCGREYLAGGWCKLHYKRVRETGKPGAVGLIRIVDRPCSVRGCHRKHAAFGLCGMHRQRKIKFGEIGGAAPLIRRGGQPLNKNGYLYQYMPESVHATNNYVAIHRLVMAEHLGRKLFPEETVHHKNGVKTDNRLENLELWSSYHPSGQRVSDRIADAIAFLKHYANDDSLWPKTAARIRTLFRRL